MSASTVDAGTPPRSRPALPGRRALVTGAGTRVGASIAQTLGAAGMDVAVHYHGSKEGARASVQAIDDAGGRAFAIAADLTDPSAVCRLVDTAVARLDGLDLLVLSAASFEAVPFAEIDPDAWDRTLALNLRAPFLAAQRAAPALARRRGSIVFISCTSATKPYPGYLPYVVSKGALRTMMRAMAIELAPEVRVNAVAPGTVLPPIDMPVAVVEALRKTIPLGRIGDARDVADAVLYLAGAEFVTGQEIPVDGGAGVT